MKVDSRVPRPYRALAALGILSLSSLACTSTVSNPDELPGTGGSTGQAGGSSTAGSGTTAGGPSGGGGGGGVIDPSKGGTRLRVLTRSEYQHAVTDLLGTIKASLELPADLSDAGFISVGASKVAVNTPSVELYEAASRAATAEVFADAARWQTIVGCQPKADLSDACVETFVKGFGKRAFRRELSAEEVTQWLTVGKETAQLAASAAPGLAAITSGLLQSPYFLYRVEVNRLDAANGRLKFDGTSTATRLAFLLTGRPPSEALIADGIAGKLDTVEGIRAAATPLLSDTDNANRMAEFFSEYSQAQLVMVVQKSAELFPNFNDALKASMLQATQLFIKNVVMAPTADVRSFFDSNQTFVDANLAPIYGVNPPASGFAQITLGAETGRAGILGQAAVLAGHSQPDHNSPTRRGIFIATNLMCQAPPPPPPGVIAVLPNDPTLTERQKLEKHRENPSCAACHALFDPPGLALEHFNTIGQYQADDHGKTIDATGTLDGIAFNGLAELGAALRQSPRAMSCMVGNFYRHVNAVQDTKADPEQVTALAATLSAKGYIWRDFVSEFIVSDAFRSAPAVAAAGGSQ